MEILKFALDVLLVQGKIEKKKTVVTGLKKVQQMNMYLHILIFEIDTMFKVELHWMLTLFSFNFVPKDSLWAATRYVGVMGKSCYVTCHGITNEFYWENGKLGSTSER